MVDSQNGDGCSANWRPADQDWTVPTKVGQPLMATRMKEPDDSSGQIIDARQIWPLVSVAPETGKTEVGEECSPAMLASGRHDLASWQR